MTARVIGLGGRLRAGKDAVADYLVENHGFVKMGMSDALHEAMLAIDPILDAAPNIGLSVGLDMMRYGEAVAQFGYVGTKARYPEARRLLQNLGTEVGRNMIGENTWVNIMARKVDDKLDAGQPVVVTGIRFPNELRMIHQFAGETVWVERPGQDSGAASSHASENGVSSEMFDTLLFNDGTLEDLYLKARHLA